MNMRADRRTEHDHHRAHGRDGYDVGPTHRHPPQPDLEDTPLAYHQVMQMAVVSLLVEKGVVTADEMRAQVERMDALGPARGARLVARAWVDDGFRERLLADSKAAAAELGIDVGPIPILVMENTPETHNFVVCTLCSCYPRFLLGRPARLVQVAELPQPRGARAAPGAGGVRDRDRTEPSGSGSTTAPPTCGT